MFLVVPSTSLVVYIVMASVPSEVSFCSLVVVSGVDNSVAVVAGFSDVDDDVDSTISNVVFTDVTMGFAISGVVLSTLVCTITAVVCSDVSSCSVVVSVVDLDFSISEPLVVTSAVTSVATEDVDFTISCVASDVNSALASSFTFPVVLDEVAADVNFIGDSEVEADVITDEAYKKKSHRSQKLFMKKNQMPNKYMYNI